MTDFVREVQVYEEVWNLADRLAEKESQEAEHIPPIRYTTYTDSKGNEHRTQTPWVRQDYKDDSRTGHIVNMMELILNKGKTND